MTDPARRDLRAAVKRLEVAFPMPSDEDSDPSWEVFGLAESIEAAITSGGLGTGFSTASYNAAVADIRELVARYKPVLSQQQWSAVEAVRTALSSQ